jgi:beta-N-acetylhexosaminidase
MTDHPTDQPPGAHPTGSPPAAHPTDQPPGAHPTDAHLLRAYPVNHLTDELRAEVAAGEVPGLTLFSYINIGSVRQVRTFTAALQAARPAGTPPLIIAADQEGGQLQGLGEEATPFAGNLALGAVGDTHLAERVGAALGREAAACGVNVAYAPVCDVLDHPSNPALGIRSFGDDPQQVGALAAAFVRGIRSAGVAATLKHFPGKGGVTVDTHHHLGIIEADRDALDAHEFAAFREPIQAGAEMVMSGHFAVPALTGRRDLPATLAREAMHDVLRDGLGFDGVTITDALDMAALAQGAGQIIDALAALRAGVDLLLCGPDEAANRRLRDGLRQAWARRLLDPAGLRASADRVDRLRRHLDVAEQPDLEVVGCSEHLALADELARRSITLVRDDAGLLPLTLGSDAEVVVIEPRPRDLTPADTSAAVRPTLATAVRRRFPRTRGIVVEGSPSEGEVRAVSEASHAADLVVLGVAAAASDPGEALLVPAVAGRGVPVVGVALRSPADLAALGAIPTVLCTYGLRPPSTEALAAALTGEVAATGTLPIRMPS